MIELNGKFTNAKIYAKTLDEKAVEQVQRVVDHPIFDGASIRIMPDCHSGKGSVIGFTSTMPKNGEIIPNLIGVDQSCGMLCVKLNKTKNDRDYLKLDKVIRNYIPTGAGGVRKEVYRKVSDNDYIVDMTKEASSMLGVEYENQLKKIGTLGGGNHFISIEKGEDANYLIIHSGSRNIGLLLAEYYQRMAIEKHCYGEGQDKELSFIDGKDAEDYLRFAKYCDEYARLSRRTMADIIIDEMGFDEAESFTTVHNYINQDDMIIRKGAVSCKKDETILIPINMAYGSFIVRGLGNEDWNNSAPHGAGRVYSRTKAFAELSMKDYKESMKGIHSDCITPKTLDESPMAYKDGEEIKELIVETGVIVDHLKPVYNFKSPN
ncbi:MAG: RtcB family protein [Lachnospiraceae bacterium]|nr:RtcB family protein [Lachnospiraceae bacterium]